MKMFACSGFGFFTIARKILEAPEYDGLGDVDRLQCGEEAECYLFSADDDLTQVCSTGDNADSGEAPEFVMLYKK